MGGENSKLKSHLKNLQNRAGAQKAVTKNPVGVSTFRSDSQDQHGNRGFLQAALPSLFFFAILG